MSVLMINGTETSSLSLELKMIRAINDAHVAEKMAPAEKIAHYVALNR